MPAAANPGVLMSGDTQYFPTDGPYWPTPYTIYAQYAGSCPNPCRKYHVSSDVPSAELVAKTVLPYLAARRIMHKVVQRRSLLVQQMAGDQAGKFITIYMKSNVEHVNRVIQELGEALGMLRTARGIQPSPRIPRARSYSHVFIEQPLDREMFIYGGFICDPSD
jgi:hypothetical protein